jgi:HK97 family phage major capsid protein
MPADTVEQLTLLDKLRRKRDDNLNALGALIDKRTEERSTFEQRKDDDKPTDEQRSTFAAAEEAFGEEFARQDAEIKTLDKRIAEQEILEQRRQTAARASGTSVGITSEPLTYRKDNSHQVSYFRDLATATVRGIEIADPAQADERLRRHASEMAVEMPKREATRERRATEAVDRAERDFTRTMPVETRGLDSSVFERRVNPNTTDGQGGYSVPPLWVIDEYIMLQRAGRVASNLVRSMPLPEGTNQINIPKLNTGTAVGPQAENSAVLSQDLTDTSISCAVRTIAGQEDVSIQLLEQSPGGIMDRVIMEDLLADYNRLVDRDCVYGGGDAANKIKGIWPAANWSGATITSATAGNTGPGFFQTQGAMLSSIATNRFSTENVHFLMPPRRWFWWATQLDGTSGAIGKPLIGSAGYGPFDAEAMHHGTPPEGMVGSSKMGPFNYYISANCPTTAAAASTTVTANVVDGAFDQILACKWDDIWLFEGALRTRVLPEVLSGTLQIRFQIYAYVSQIVRYGSSIVVAQGAGLPQPKGLIDTAMAF